MTLPAADGIPSAPPAPAGRVGPNAIVRTAEALDALLGPGAAGPVFARAGLGAYLTVPPEAMVEADEVARLNAALWRALPPDAADAVAREAGRRTGDYLLARRIPRWAPAVLRPVPARIALRLLMRAVARNAWTFVGDGRFDWRVLPGGGVAVVLERCPLAADLRAAAPVCGLYAATFERLAVVLASRRARCTETACTATGAPACRFEIAPA